MRLSIECILEKDEISTSYNRKILSFFKKALEAYNKDIKKFFYDEPMEKEMTFSCYFFIEKIENNKILVQDIDSGIFDNMRADTISGVIDGKFDNTQEIKDILHSETIPQFFNRIKTKVREYYESN